MATPPLRSSGLALTVFAGTLLLGACDAGVVAGDPSAAQRGGLIGSLDEGPGLLSEPAQAGLARGLRLVDVRWGRLVDVYAHDPLGGQPQLVLEGFVADPFELGEGPEVELDPALVGSGKRLTIRHAPGTSGFARELERLEAGLVPLPVDAPALHRVPRDATLVLRFDDLVEPQSVVAQALTLLVEGVPVPAAVEASRSHGTIVSAGRRSARLVLPLAPSLAAAADARVTLALACSGPATLTNLSGHALAASGAAAAFEIDFQAGGSAAGVLLDSDPPFVVGTLPGQVTAVVPASGSRAFTVDFTFATAACAFAAQRGDVLSTPGHLAEVLVSSGPPAGGATVRMRVRLRSGDPTTFLPAAAQLRARWSSAVSAPPECFVTILPTPAQAPANGASTASVVQVAFSEPMDPASVRALDTFRLAYGQPAQPGALAEHVVGTITPSAGLREYTFGPTLPLRHSSGVPERYFVRLSGGPTGVRDLAGNALGFDLPQTSLLIDRNEATQDTGSLSLGFAAIDEDGDGAPELRGQVLYDLSVGAVRGRPVARFSSVVDPAQPLVGAMSPLAGPLQTPLNPLGAKLMSVWRYVDMGFSLLDDSYHNLDVEGLAWATFAGTALPDQFAQFRMALAHARYLPDEVQTSGLLPSFKNSGLVTTYDSDLLSTAEDPLTVVHDKAKGYVIDPLDLFVAATGTAMMPWPMNRNLSPSQFVYWTWRDTAKLALGGPLGAGADPTRLSQVMGPGTGLLGFYPAGGVPSIALPLLTEFRCYPDPAALGLNGFYTAIAINSSSRPTFRAYSAGGIGPAGTKLVDPDNEPVATGGINPSTGASTLPIDNAFYFGQADFVVRVSRAHTRWLDAGGATLELAGVLEDSLPAGTQLQVAYRGASSLSATTGEPWRDAANLGPYGDPYTPVQLTALGLPGDGAFAVQFFPTAGSPRWSDDVSALAGARFVQVRISFVADALSQVVPALDGLGIAWRR